MKSAISLCLLLAASLAQAQPVRFEMFTPEPIRFEMFTAAPVQFDMFSASPDKPKKAKPIDPEKEKVPPPLEELANPRIPVVWVYGMPGCGKDRIVIADYAAAVKSGAKLPYEMRCWPRSQAVPPWVIELGVCPVIHFPSKQTATGWDMLSGEWPGIEEFTFIFRRANKIPEPASRRQDSGTGRIPVPLSRWSYPGRIQDHLREHGWTGATDDLSVQQMEQIHGALHEGLILPDGSAPRQNSSTIRTRPANEASLVSSRHRVRRGGKQMDPFTIISILGVVFRVGEFMFGHCGG